MKLSVQGYGVQVIARKMGRSPSTIRRELSRNAGTDNSYSAYEANRKYRDRRTSCRPKLKLANAKTKELLLAYLREGWSPKQIVGRLGLCSKQKPEVSVTTIYHDVPSYALKTLTLDNGKEFAGREEITALTGLSVYFAHPGHPGERGTNENMNGHIRKY